MRLIGYETRVKGVHFCFFSQGYVGQPKQVFFDYPVLADPKLDFFDEQGRPALGRVQDVNPFRLPDLFEGDQLVLLGRYIGADPLRFVLSGNYRGEKKRFPALFRFSKASSANAFVPRLWASRRISVLIDKIRLLGADRPMTTAQAANSPILRELVEEVVRLSEVNSPRSKSSSSKEISSGKICVLEDED